MSGSYIKHALAVLALAAAGVGSLTAYQFYQWHYLSPELRRTLVAVMEDEYTSDKDFSVYIRDARSHVRTSRDAALLSKIQKAAQWGEEVTAGRDRTLNMILDGLQTVRMGLQRSIDSMKTHRLSIAEMDRISDEQQAESRKIDNHR